MINNSLPFPQPTSLHDTAPYFSNGSTLPKQTRSDKSIDKLVGSIKNHSPLVKPVQLSSEFPKTVLVDPELDDSKMDVDSQIALHNIGVIPPTDADSAQIYSDELTITLSKIIGQGTYSQVHAACVIPHKRFDANGIHFSPKKPQNLAMKITKKQGSFVPCVNNLKDISNVGIDKPILVFNDKAYKGYALHELYQSDLSHYKFPNVPDSIISMLKIAKDCAVGLKNCHDKNKIHRDIKGPNILVSSDGKAVLTDFDFLDKQQSKIHFTIGTPEYLDPAMFMFGNQENTLINQKLRRGVQDSGGDIFALGMTMINDVLLKFFGSQNSPEINEILKDAKPIIKEGTWTDADLKMFAMQYPLRAVLRESIPDPQMKKVIIFPENEKVLELLLSASLKLQYEPRYIFALQELINLACEMRKSNPAERPSAAKIIHYLDDLLENLENANKNKRKEIPDADKANPLNKSNSPQSSKKRKLNLR